MSNEPKRIPVAWRQVSEGRQLSTGLWWVAYAGAARSGRFYWKLPGKDCHYVDALEVACAEAEAAVLAGFDGCEYILVDEVPHRLNELASLFKQSMVR